MSCPDFGDVCCDIGDTDTTPDTDTTVDTDTGDCAYECTDGVSCWMGGGEMHTEMSCPDFGDVCCEFPPDTDTTDTDTTDTDPGSCTFDCIGVAACWSGGGEFHWEMSCPDFGDVCCDLP